MYLIIGLGNPGKEYEETRHNLGFKVVEELAARLNVSDFKHKFKSYVAETTFKQRKIILAEPQTFMNNSGEALSELTAWYKFPPKNFILIYDDVDLPVGEIRVRDKGSSGGHRGVESILQHVKSSEFTRIRIGIGKDELIDTADYVLQKIPPTERETLAQAVNSAAQQVLNLITA